MDKMDQGVQKVQTSSPLGHTPALPDPPASSQLGYVVTLKSLELLGVTENQCALGVLAPPGS